MKKQREGKFRDILHSINTQVTLIFLVLIFAIFGAAAVMIGNALKMQERQVYTPSLALY